MEQLPGQLSIWDIHPKTKRPCEYSFQRYIGQSVRCGWSGHIGKIIAIEPYYTEVECIDGEIYAWTPTNTIPFEFHREEWEVLTKEDVIDWNKAITHIPIVELLTTHTPPDNIDLVIHGEVNGKPALIGFSEWNSGPNGCFKDYYPEYWKENKT